MTSNLVKTVLIVGGGHASLPVIKMGKKWKKHVIHIKLISAKPYLIYYGALPQFMAGFYEWNQTAINLEKLCNRYEVPFTADKIVSVDEKRKTVVTSHGHTISYDYLLLNVGATAKPIFEGDSLSLVKPMSKLLNLRKKIMSGSVQNLLIVGGGAAGRELALNLSHPALMGRPEITILDKNDRLLSSFPQKIIQAGNFHTEESLQVKEYPAVFAAGDMADIGGNNYQQIGVHAVKQGILLRKNLKAAILGEPLTDYKPYFTNPIILSNGPDSAFYVMGRWALKGRIYAILKYLLDMRWLDKYTQKSDNRRSDWQLFKEGVVRSGTGRKVKT